MLYGERKRGGEHGVVHTRQQVVEVMLDMVGYDPARNLQNVRILDPSAGYGAFSRAIIARLLASSRAHGFDVKEALNNVRFFEIDEASASILRNGLLEEFNELGPDDLTRIVCVQDYLLSPNDTYDVIVGNPPYVRHENIPAEQRDAYKRLFSTFSSRSDLYIPFYEKGLRSLSKGGVLSFICANRWLKNQYGKRLRRLVASSFDLTEIIDLENADVFEDSVSAYPAITTIRHTSPTKKSKYYSLEDVDSLGSWPGLGAPDIELSLRHDNWFRPDYRWNGRCVDLTSMEDQGFQVGIGVATGKDAVFIQDEFPADVESELILPILKTRDLRGKHIAWGGKHLLSPYDANGQLIALDDYPGAKAFFESHAEALKGRHVARKSPQRWYRTIDRVKPGLLHQPKIVLPDMTGNGRVFIDDGQYYPHHNLYYILHPHREFLEVMAGLLMTDFVRDQLESIGNKMNGGFPRWQSQYLRQLRVPRISSMPEGHRQDVRSAWQSYDADRLNELLNVEVFSTFDSEPQQGILFS